MVPFQDAFFHYIISARVYAENSLINLERAA